MKNYDLSILIPSRNEMFISNTVADILKNKRGNTEIIVGLDGAWAEPGIVDHPDVRIVYAPEARGQRGMTNTLARLSTAKYLAKCDAHCAFDEGFDVKLMDAMKDHDNWTVVPTMRNLHAFDWKCMKCGKKTYQGPTPGTAKGIDICEDCGNTDYSTFQRKLVWYPKPSPQSTAYCFDPEPHFQYFNSLKHRLEGDITPTMSLQGSFFMMTRDKYWELNICDESFGSWGSQGIEVACKTWLTGGEVMCVQTTWYAHMFRTQGGDFSFPYEQKQNKVVEAKQKARDTFFNGQIPGQQHPLSWLVEKFWPVDHWTDKDLATLKESERGHPVTTVVPTKGIIFYTDNQLNLKLAHKVQDYLKATKLPIVSASLKPMDFGTNVHLPLKRGTLTYHLQIIAALEKLDTDVVFFAEHDVLYHPSHFDFSPPEKDKFYYNHNVWRTRPDGFAVHWDANQVAELVCYRELALNWYKEKLDQIVKNGFDRRYEPGGRDTNKYERWTSAYPNIDVRHGANLTKSKWSPDDFRDKSTCVNWEESTIDAIPGWDTAILKKIV